jgi:hypothetical protein
VVNVQPSFWSRKQLWFLIGAIAVLIVAWPVAANAAGSSLADNMQAEIEAQAGSMTANMAPAASALQNAAGGVAATPTEPAPPAAAPAPSAAPLTNGGAAAPAQSPPPPATDPAPAPTTDSPAPAPAAPDPGQSNMNVSIRVLSPGNDGATIQQNVAIGTGGITATPSPVSAPPAASTPGAPDVWNWNWDCGNGSAPPAAPPSASSATVWNWNWTGDCQAAVQQLQALSRDMPQQPVLPSMLQTPSTSPAPARHHHKRARPASANQAAIAALHSGTPFVHAQPLRAQTATHVRPAPSGRSRKAESPPPQVPYQLPLPEDQNLGAGPPGGSSTPPPAPLAVLLAAACFGASTLVSRLRDAHRRRRSRLFASRLERPG